MGQIWRERIETELAWPVKIKHLLEAYGALSAGLPGIRSVFSCAEDSRDTASA